MWIHWKGKEQDGAAFLSTDGRRLEFTFALLNRSLCLALSQLAFCRRTGSVFNPKPYQFSKNSASRTSQIPHDFSCSPFSLPIAFEFWDNDIRDIVDSKLREPASLGVMTLGYKMSPSATKRDSPSG